MTRSEKLAESLLKPINPSIIIILGVYTVVWGLWIANPFWTVFTQAPLYNALATISPTFIGAEVFWGLIAVVSGLVTMRGAMKPSYENLKFGSFVGFLHWFVIALLYFVGDWQSTGGITSLCFAIYSGLVWVNVKVNKTNFISSNQKFRIKKRDMVKSTYDKLR